MIKPAVIKTTIAAAVLAIGLSDANAAEAPPGRTLGFVVRDWFSAYYTSKFADECPEGLAISNDQIWWRGISKEERALKTENGLYLDIPRLYMAMQRGPDGEDVCMNSTVVKDPPLRIVEGQYSFGVNIDGNVDGSATPKTCAHKNFTHPDGTLGIDNQMYRLLGCIYGWRKGGLPESNAHEARGTSGLGMILIEITDVDDTQNDDDITVFFHRSIDQFAFDGAGKPLPFSSYNIDVSAGAPRYGDLLKGRIQNDVITTVRGDVKLPFYGNYMFLQPTIRDMDLKLEIAADGASAKGLVSGYYDIDTFIHYIGGMVGHTSTADSCPATYDAAYELADGYPDPVTGKCTHLSTAIEIGAHAAFIIHPPAAEKKVAAGQAPRGGALAKP